LSLGPSPARIDASSTDGRTTLIAIDDVDQPLAVGDLEHESHVGYLYCAPEAAGKGLAAALYDQLEQIARERGWPGRYRDLEPWQQAELRRHPEVMAVRERQGIHGSAALFEQVNQERDEALNTLEEMLRTGRIDQRTARNRYHDLQAAAFNKRQGIMLALGRDFGPQDVDKLSPEERALHDYHQLGEELTEGGVFMGGLQDARNRYLAGLSPELQEYVLRNTNLGEIPPLVLQSLSATTRQRIMLSEAARERASEPQQETVDGLLEQIRGQQPAPQQEPTVDELLERIRAGAR
jgi:GNAT superfamily N-acetyltransferase